MTIDLLAGREPTSEQTDLWNAVGDQRAGHILVRARAGSAKTTSILMSLTRVMPHQRALCLAFSKSIADENAAKISRVPGIKARVESKSFNGFGHRTLIKKRPGAEFLDTGLCEMKRVEAAFEKLFPDAIMRLDRKDQWILKRTVRSAVTMVKWHHGTDAAWRESVAKDQYASFLGEARGVRDSNGEALVSLHEFTEVMTEAVRASCRPSEMICYDDQVFVPVTMGWSVGAYDYVFVDEAQDLSPVQLEIAHMACRPKSGRMVVVGDDLQAIFGWRGAAIDSMDRMSKRLEAKEMKLTTCFRCARMVADVARKHVPDIQTPDWMPDGNVIQGGPDRLLYLEPGDFVIARLNAPLAKAAMVAMQEGLPVSIMGAAFVERFDELQRDSGAKTVAHLVDYAANNLEREVANLDARGEQARINRLMDDHEVLETIAATTKSLDQLRAKMRELAVDMRQGVPRDRVIFSSVHRIKGLETKRAFVLQNTFRFSAFASEPEERNAWYIAVTRAREQLVLVDSKGVTDGWKEDNQGVLRNDNTTVL